MSTNVTLPPSLRQRIAAVARRVRLLRAARGLALVVLLLAGTAGAAALADFGLDLPANVRQAVFASWLGLGAVAFLGAVVFPLFRRLQPAALAAVIEEKYPDLGERLTSAVELSDCPDSCHGSPLMLALLMEDAEHRTRPLDFRPAVPARSAGRWAFASALAVLALAASSFAWPDRAGPLAERFFRPWHVPPETPPYTLAVTPGHTFAARGRPLTLAAHLTPRDTKVVLPPAATLVATDLAGKETRHPMEADGAGSFTLSFKVPGDLTYRVEAGVASSETYSLTAVIPVELAADSPTITITPPAYARAAIDTETFHGLVDLSALQHSDLCFDFRFNRPAVAARLEWTTQEIRETRDGTKTVPHVTSHVLPLREEGLAASWTLPAKVHGSYRLVLEAEHGILTEREGGTLTVRPDLAPAFLKFNGKEDLRAVLAYDRLPLEVRLGDDIGVAGAELEYRINDRQPQVEPLTLQGTNTREATGALVFSLAGKVKEDDEVAYRFRAVDNLPGEYQGPHVVYYPADRWLRLKIARRGESVKDREVLAQRDEINRRLEAIKADLLKEQRGVYRTQQDTRFDEMLKPEQAQQVRQLQEDNQASQQALRELAQLAASTPALEPLAERAEDVAKKEMQGSKNALEQARRADTVKARTTEFRRTDRELAAALQRLEELKKTNEQIAKERLDQNKVEQLADREKHLAEKAAELARKHPARDPEAQKLTEQLKREQAEVAEELRKLTEQSEPLRRALEEARSEQARQAAERARELARAQRDLARAAAETERNANAQRLGELARRQQEVAEKAERLSQETRQPARSANADPLRPEEAARAVEDLKKGDSETAMRRQEQVAREMERLAAELDRAAQVSRDPREAARQLARLEAGLRQRVEEETARRNAGRPPAERPESLKAEQEAVRQAAEKLSVPPNDTAAQQDRKAAVDRAAEAAKALQERDARQAAARLEQARQALERLADRLPTLEQRTQQAQRELARLAKQQEAIARDTAQLRKDAPETARKMTEAARRQAEVAEALGKMDVPNQEARQQRTQEALNRALADLMDGKRQDAAASQEEARRQLERLQQALAGRKPADEAARDLARQQRDLAAQADRLAANPKATAQQKEDIARKQQQVAEQTRNLQAPEAQKPQAEAAQATRRAAEAARAEPLSPEASRQMQEAARKLDELARRMAGEPAGKPGEQSQKAQAPSPSDGKTQTPNPSDGKTQARSASEGTPQEQARRLAQKQRELARATQRAQDESNRRGGEAGKQALQKAMEQLGRQQQELNRQASGLPANGAQRTLQEAREAMDQARQALGRSEPQQAVKNQVEAARALDRLAQQAPNPSQARRASEGTDPQAGTPQGLPSKEQAEQARQLAREQRDLRDAVQRAAQAARSQPLPAGENPLAELAKQQQEIARDAANLERQVGREQADNPTQQQARQASQSAQRAADQVQAGAVPRARQAGEQAAQQFQQLARQLAQQPAGDDPQPGRDPAQQAQQLARRQAEVNRRLAAQAENPDAQRAQQQARQDDLRRQSGELAQNLQRMAQQMSRSSQSQQAAQQAAQQASQSAGQAQQAQQQAQQQSRQGQQGQAQQSQEQAAQALDRAAQQAAQAAGQQGSKPSPGQQAGQAVQQAQGQMSQAQGQLAQGQNSGAQQSMQQAAQSLQQAAASLAQSSNQGQQQGQPGQPQPNSNGLNGVSGSGEPDLTAFGLDRTKFSGKTWGELPGELRTRIVQDMKAKYGDDYARMIKLYFEQIAARSRPAAPPPPVSAGPQRK
jgi:hypothetical protein